MQVELKRLHQQLGMTFLFVTHDQEEALAMADRIAVMREGTIVQLGSGTEIYRDPATRYVADFIGEANLIACDVSAAGEVALAPIGLPLPYRVAGGRQGRASLMIRPEDIAVGKPSSSADAVVLEAQVKDKVFVGSSWRFYLVLQGGQEIAAQLTYGPHVDRLSSGDTTSVHWRRDAARVLFD